MKLTEQQRRAARRHKERRQARQVEIELRRPAREPRVFVLRESALVDKGTMERLRA